MGLLRVSSFVLIYLFAMSVVYADVSISNTYYTNGCEGHEGVFLDNMDYSNSIVFSQASFSASSQANMSEQSENGIFKHSGFLESIQGMQGAALNVCAEDLGYTRTMTGGNSNRLLFNYLADSGRVQADYFTPYASYQDDLTLVNNRYVCNLGVYDAKSYSMGNGESVVNESSSFKQNIFLTYLGKYCEIKSSFETDENYNPAVATPVSYEWSGYTSIKDYAVAGIRMKVKPGNRGAVFGIAGSSSILKDKFAPDLDDPLETYPATFDNSGTGLPKNLIIQYRINQTGLWI